MLAAPLHPIVEHIDAKTLWKTAHGLTQAILFRNSDKPSVAEKAIEMMGENQESLMQLTRDLADQNAKTQASLVESNERTMQRMLESQERNLRYIVDALQPAAKNAVAPIGKTCTCMQVGDTAEESEDKTFMLDEAAARAVRAHKMEQTREEKILTIHLMSIAVPNRSCRFRIAGRRGPSFKARIYDVAFSRPGDPYTSALSARTPLRVRVEEIQVPNRKTEFNILSIVPDDTDT